MSILVNKYNLGSNLKKMNEDVLSSPATQKIILESQNKEEFRNNLFMDMIRYTFFQQSYFDERELEISASDHTFLPQKQEAIKKLEQIRKKFLYKNHQEVKEEINFYEGFDIFSGMEEQFLEGFGQDWILNKIIEIKVSLILLAGVSLKKEIDYSEIIKIPNNEINDFILDFLVNKSYFDWKIHGFYVNEDLVVEVYEEAILSRLIEYQTASLV